MAAISCLARLQGSDLLHNRAADPLHNRAADPLHNRAAEATLPDVIEVTGSKLNNGTADPYS